MVKRITIIEYIFLGILFSCFVAVSYKYYGTFMNEFVNNTTNHIRMELVYMRLKKKFAIQLKSLPKYSATQATASAIPVLMYHGVTKTGSKEDISEENFFNQMLILKQLGYKTISLQDFNKYILHELSLPEKSILITFDDGRKDSYYPVDPILKIFDYHAVLFVIADHILENKQSKYYLTHNEIKKINNNSRWEIQSHGNKSHTTIITNSNNQKGHFISSKKWIDTNNREETNDEFKTRINNDLALSKVIISEITSKDVFAYAFPFGDFGQNSEESENIITTVFNTARNIFNINFYQFRPESVTGYYRYNYFNKVNDGLYRRILIPGDSTGTWLKEVLDAGMPKELPYLQANNSKLNWVTTTNGITEIKDGKLEMRTTKANLNAATYLDGTQNWENFKMELVIQMPAGSQYSILGKVADGSNYISCNYSNDKVTVTQTINGTNKVYNTKKNINFYKLNSENKISLTIKDRKAICTMNSNIRVDALIDKHFPNGGGVGIKIWGNGNISNIIVKNIYVTKN